MHFREVLSLLEDKNSEVRILISDTMADSFCDESRCLDFDLARIYGYTTKRFNEQVKRNEEKFPERYRFQLIEVEFNSILRSQIATSRWGGSRYLPYAFTEQGIYMLMTVLKGELAVRQSIVLIDTFKQMKDYLMETNNLVSANGLIKLTEQVHNNTTDIKDIKNQLEVVMDNFIDPSKYKHYLIKNGERIESDVAYQEIYKRAMTSIYIIDDYIDVKTLQLLKSCKDDISIIIITDNKGKNNLNENYINDFIKDTGFNITLKPNNNVFHDRYIVIDFNTNNYTLYHCGHSSKDSGNSVDTIMEVSEKELYKSLIGKAINYTSKKDYHQIV